MQNTYAQEQNHSLRAEVNSQINEEVTVMAPNGQCYLIAIATADEVLLIETEEGTQQVCISGEELIINRDEFIDFLISSWELY